MSLLCRNSCAILSLNKGFWLATKMMSLLGIGSAPQLDIRSELLPGMGTERGPDRKFLLVKKSYAPTTSTPIGICPTVASRLFDSNFSATGRASLDFLPPDF